MGVLIYLSHNQAEAITTHWNTLNYTQDSIERETMKVFHANIVVDNTQRFKDWAVILELSINLNKK